MMRRVLLLFSFVELAIAQMTHEQQADTHARQSYGLLKEGRLTEAEAEMKAAIRLAPTSALYHSALAGLFTQSGNLAQAKAELEQALLLPSASAVHAQFLDRLKEVDLNLGAQHAPAKQYQEGLRVAEGAAKLFPDDPSVLQMRGYFDAKLQRNRDAVNSYSRALQLDPGSAAASVGLGTAQFSAGLEKESVQTLEHGLERFQQDAMHYQALAVVLLRLSEAGQDTAARSMAMFHKALQLDSTLPEAHYELGRAALHSNDLEGAKAHLLAAEHAAPDDSRAHFALARLYNMQGDQPASEREMKIFLSARAAEHSQNPSKIGTSEH